MPRFIYLCRTSFILVLCQRTVMLKLASEQTWALKTSSELWKATSLFEKTRLLQSLFCCSSNDSQSIFFFFIFTYVVLFSFCTQIFLFTRCEVAENNNCRQWLKNNWLFARKQLLELDLSEASKTNPYVQFSVLSNDSVCLV